MYLLILQNNFLNWGQDKVSGYQWGLFYGRAIILLHFPRVSFRAIPKDH